MAGTNPLDLVEIRTRAKDKADREWREAILLAHVNGYSYSAIGRAAGLTHEGVRGIIKKAGL